MPSSYQVVLWKQESFVVLRPLQIEFFRSLLERIRTVPFQEHNDFASTICVQPHGSARLTSSLWWRSPPDISSVTLDHDVLCKLPSLWGGG
jgi:hypothetical protein